MKKLLSNVEENIEKNHTKISERFIEILNDNKSGVFDKESPSKLNPQNELKKLLIEK